MIFFSTKHIEELTKTEKSSGQISWLIENNYRFIVNGSGKPVVFKNQVLDRLNKNDGLLTRQKIVRKAIPIKPICGVYFLLNGSEIVYIGKSINLIERIGNHYVTLDMSFNSYSYIEERPNNLETLEKAYINKLSPRMNKNHISKTEKLALCGEPIKAE